MQVSSLEADSDPADADLLIHVLNELTCLLHQKLRAFKMHTKVGARSSIFRYAVSYMYMYVTCVSKLNIVTSLRLPVTQTCCVDTTCSHGTCPWCDSIM